MSSLGTGKGLLEIGKFAVYVAVPVALTYAVATENKAFQKIMGLVRSFSISPFSFHFLYV
jgi:protein PET100, fungi type